MITAQALDIFHAGNWRDRPSARLCSPNFNLPLSLSLQFQASTNMITILLKVWEKQMSGQEPRRGLKSQQEG
jgi:hypothetical protein